MTKHLLLRWITVQQNSRKLAGNSNEQLKIVAWLQSESVKYYFSLFFSTPKIFSTPKKIFYSTPKIF
jgi:hypothetical protein